MAQDVNDRKKTAHALYEKYVKPLEAEHRGEYVAVSQRGQIVFGSAVADVIRKASASFGPGNFIFMVGQRAIGKWL